MSRSLTRRSLEILLTEQYKIMQYTEDTKKLSQFITDKMGYYETHGKGQEVEILTDLINTIGDLMQNETDRRDWYNLCNTIAPEDHDENSL